MVHRPTPRAGPAGAKTPAATVGLVCALGVPLGAALTGLYLWKRNLPFVIVVHFVVNAPQAVLALAG